VHGLKLPTVEFQIIGIQAILETVELDEPALAKRNPKMLSAQVPETRHLERII
jgi:hypothetical protein